MGVGSSRENEPAALAFVDRMTSEHAVTVFSKSYCPYCDLVGCVCSCSAMPAFEN